VRRTVTGAGFLADAPYHAPRGASSGLVRMPTPGWRRRSRGTVAINYPGVLNQERMIPYERFVFRASRRVRLGRRGSPLPVCLRCPEPGERPGLGAVPAVDGEWVDARGGAFPAALDRCRLLGWGEGFRSDGPGASRTERFCTTIEAVPTSGLARWAVAGGF
jgi:hypothetical protein